MGNDKPQKIRTGQQNRAEHKLFEEIAVELNNRGITMKALIQELQIDHTKESVKSIFRAIAKAKYGKDSTAILTTTETQECYEELNRLLAPFEIHIAWPSQESQYLLSAYGAEINARTP